MGIWRLLRLLRGSQRHGGRGGRAVDDPLGSCDAAEVGDQESGRPSEADDRSCQGYAEAVAHIAPGTDVLEALRLGLNARCAREANSSAFM